MITINFFAALREQLECSKTQLNVSSPITVEQARLLLVEQNPNWQNALKSNSLLSAVNHEMVQDDHLVQPNDELAFFPPVTGG